VSSTVADLEIATFGIEQIVEGTQTGRDDTTLTVSSSQLAVGAGEPALAEATVEVVRPDDPVHVSNVRAASPGRVRPRLRTPSSIPAGSRTGAMTWMT
jgi:hypothetical protein